MGLVDLSVWEFVGRSPLHEKYAIKIVEEDAATDRDFLKSAKGWAGPFRTNCYACCSSGGKPDYFKERVQEILDNEGSKNHKNKRGVGLLKEACDECFSEGALVTLAYDLSRIYTD